MLIKKIIIFILLIIALPLVLSSQTNQKAVKEMERIAVMELEAKGVSKNEADTVADFLRTDLTETKKFIVIERARIADVLKEQELSLSGLTESKNASKVGEILNCDTIIVGTLSKMGNEYFLNVRAIDVETAKTKIAKRESSTNLENLSEVSWFIACKLADIKYVPKRKGAALFNSPPLGFDFQYGFSSLYYKMKTMENSTIGTQERETETKRNADMGYSDLRFGIYLSALYLGLQNRSFTLDKNSEVETEETVNKTNTTTTAPAGVETKIKCRDLMIGYRKWTRGKLNPKITYFSWRTVESQTGSSTPSKYAGPCLGVQTRSVTEIANSPIDFIIGFGLHVSYLFYDEPAGFKGDVTTIFGGAELGIGLQLKNIGLFALLSYTGDAFYVDKTDKTYESTTGLIESSDLYIMHGFEIRIGYTFDAQVLFK